MSDEAPEQDQKTEDPSERKLRDAQEKGNVAKSQEVNTWFILSGAALVFALMAGPISQSLVASLKGILDLNLREKITLYPLIVLIIVFGFYPAPILDTTASAVNNLVAHYATSVGLDPAVSLADARAPLEYVAPTGEAQPAAAAPAAH